MAVVVVLADVAAADVLAAPAPAPATAAVAVAVAAAAAAAVAVAVVVAAAPLVGRLEGLSPVAVPWSRVLFLPAFTDSTGGGGSALRPPAERLRRATDEGGLSG